MEQSEGWEGKAIKEKVVRRREVGLDLDSTQELTTDIPARGCRILVLYTTTENFPAVSLHLGQSLFFSGALIPYQDPACKESFRT